MPRNAFYAQSGGVTAVINASAAGVIETARKHKAKIGKVYAGRNGILGALEEDLIDTSRESAAAIRALRHTPGGAFGSCRYKLKGVEKGGHEYERLVEVFRAHDIGYFFYNGGNDSADTCLKVSRIAKELGYPLVAVHVPKTIDNDLPVTDCSPGFGSVAKYVATSMREAGLDVESMARTSTKVFVLEVMGRHAGWITAAVGLAREKVGQAPHVLLFPRSRSTRRFLAKVAENVAPRLLRDRRLGGPARAGRQVPLGVGPQGRLRALAAGRGRADDREPRAGEARLQAPLGRGRLPAALGAPHRLADGPRAVLRRRQGRGRAGRGGPVGRDAHHRARFEPAVPLEDRPRAKLEDVANVERKMPRDFITPDGFHITAKCRNYLLPLVSGEAFPPFENGLPKYVRLKNAAVRKKTKAAKAPTGA